MLWQDQGSFQHGYLVGVRLNFIPVMCQVALFERFEGFVAD